MTDDFAAGLWSGRDFRPPERRAPVRAYQPLGSVRPPEVLICCAVLEQAIADLRGRNAKLREDAQAWIAVDEDCPFSFEWICDVLGLSASAARRRLLAPAPAATGAKGADREEAAA